MNYYDDLIGFLNSLDDFFIEVEGRSDRLRDFIDEYNSTTNSHISVYTDGIRLLGDDVDKWGLEFRLYTNERPQPLFGNDFHINRTYRPEYKYRYSNNLLKELLLYNRFHLGHN